MSKPKPKITRLRDRRAHALAGGNARHRKSEDESNRWMTPPEIVETVRENGFNGTIDLDPATEPWNPTGALRYYTKADNGLGQPWNGRIFLNPPYSPMLPWIDRAIEAEAAGARIYALVPVRTDAVYHQRLLAAATDVLFLAGRIKFGRPDGSVKGSPCFPSMIVGLGVSVRRLKLRGTIYVPTHLFRNAA